MRIFKLRPTAPDLNHGTVLTIGNFDGVHIGHQRMIAHVLQKAEKLQLPLLVVLFEPQPKEYFAGKTAPIRLFGLREKLAVLQSLSVHYVACITFDSEFASHSPEDFYKHYLIQQFYARHIVIGEDFYFGKGRSGSPQQMQALSQVYDISFEVFQVHCVRDTKVSSTLIRDYLQNSAFNQVEELLSRPYFILGRVGYGRQLGRQLGFPTANIAMQRYKSALHGVFCVKISNCRSGQEWYGVANIGYRPTIGGHKRLLEVHLFDFQGSLYGEYLQVSFLQKIRNEQKFASIDALKQQIQHDICFAKQFCEN
jgi:riboflavin kinase/FMN adenylyltransferase